MPDRQRRVPRTLRPGLAHHFHLRRVWRGGGGSAALGGGATITPTGSIGITTTRWFPNATFLVLYAQGGTSGQVIVPWVAMGGIGGGAHVAGDPALAFLLRRYPAAIRAETAVPVAALSARIGDGRSTLLDGLLSEVNETAYRLGARPGRSALEFALSVAEKLT